MKSFVGGNLQKRSCEEGHLQIIKNLDTIMKIVYSERHVSNYFIAQKLKINQKTVWNHFHTADSIVSCNSYIVKEFSPWTVPIISYNIPFPLQPRHFSHTVSTNGPQSKLYLVSFANSISANRH